MNLSEVAYMWEHLPYDEEVSGHRITETDRIFISRPYIFIVENDGNVILRKFTDGGTSIIRALRKFREWLEDEHIQYIRVEGWRKRYRLLPKLFPSSIFIMEGTENRDIYYVKVY